MHSQIFDLVKHGEFDWDSIYFNMPVWLRNFYYKKLDKYYKDKNKAMESGKGSKISRPAISSNSYNRPSVANKLPKVNLNKKK